MNAAADFNPTDYAFVIAVDPDSSRIYQPWNVDANGFMTHTAQGKSVDGIAQVRELQMSRCPCTVPSSSHSPYTDQPEGWYEKRLNVLRLRKCWGRCPPARLRICYPLLRLGWNHRAQGGMQLAIAGGGGVGGRAYEHTAHTHSNRFSGGGDRKEQHVVLGLFSKSCW